jgi:hypothetical protein
MLIIPIEIVDVNRDENYVGRFKEVGKGKGKGRGLVTASEVK